MPLPLIAGAALEGGAALASREFAKNAIKRKLAEAAASGAGAGALATGAAGVGEALVNKPKAKTEADKPKREESKMGSSKNVDAGTGRGTTTFGSNKSFKDAFKEARDAGKGTFSWNGKKYTTETAEEAKGRDAFMSESRRLADADEIANRKTADYSFGTTNPSEYKRGGKVKMSSASKRGDGCAQRGKTRGKMT